LVNAVVAERLAREDCRRGFVLDGYPRTIAQAEFLRGLLEKNGARILAIGIVVPDGLLVERLSSRWTCPTCGKVFNAHMDPDKADGRCDDCGTALIQRMDDSPEVMAERLAVYHKVTRPLIEYFQEWGAYVELDGTRTVDEVFGSMRDIITNQA
jgi:adenylate kinase